jgi:hypothetical protein
MKTLADFKRKLKVGVKLHTIFHKEFSHRLPNDDNKTSTVVYKDKDLGIREVSVVKSNAFALKTIQTNGTIIDSWCQYPKASDVKIQDDKITIYEEKGERVLTYKFVEENENT